MTEHLSELSIIPARGMPRGHAPTPSRIFGRGAATSFIVHGHRLSSLYRVAITTHFSFIVLKILTLTRLFAVGDFEYLQNNEMWGLHNA